VDEGVFKRGSCKCNEPEGNRKKSGQAALAFRQIGAFIVFQECLAQLVMIENVRDCGVFASRKFPALGLRRRSSSRSVWLFALLSASARLLLLFAKSPLLLSY
jgi:hypothetical protein